MCSPVFGQANVYNQLTRTAAETTDSADVWIPIWDQQASPRKSYKISVAELFKEPKAVAITSGSLTDSAPALDITQTWNDGTEAFTGWKLNVTDTASAAASKLLDLQVGGSSVASFSKAGTLSAIGVSRASGSLSVYGNSSVDLRTGGGNSTVFSVTSANTAVLPFGTLQFHDTDAMTLSREAADVLALRRSGNAELVRVYETYTDSTTFSRGVFGFRDAASGGTGTGSATTVLRIGTEKGSVGGTARAVSVVTDGTEKINIPSSANSALTIVGGLFTMPSSLATVDTSVGTGGTATIGVRATGTIGFSPNTDARTTPDVAFTRTGAAVVKVTDGSTGFGQLDAKRTTLTGGTITTASAPLIDAAQTWNDAAVNFTGFKQNITLTAANTNSLLFDWQVGGVSYLKLTQYGDLVGSAFTGTDFSIRMQNGSLKQGSATQTTWGSSNAAGSMDTGLARANAAIVKFTNASTGPGMMQLEEVASAPAAPPANNVIIYAIDNGSGKTQLMALFSSGAAQEIAIAP